MKESAFLFGIVISLSLNAQTYIKDWGSTGRGNGWPVLNDLSTAAGEASMGGKTRDGWATLRGGFGQTVEVSPDSAITVKGQLEFVGGDIGNTYAPLRYALTWQEDEGILENQYTDSAAWSVTSGHYGYEFAPKSGKDLYLSGYNPTGTVFTV